MNDKEPEPGPVEGLKDILIIEAIEESIRSGSRVSLEKLPYDPVPHLSQQIDKRPPKKKKLVAVESAHR